MRRDTYIKIGGREIALNANNIDRKFILDNLTDEQIKAIFENIPKFNFVHNCVDVQRYFIPVMREAIELGIVEGKSLVKCDCCGAVVDTEHSDVLNVLGVDFCPECIEKYIINCPHCNSLVHRGNLIRLELEDGSIVECCEVYTREHNLNSCPVCGVYHVGSERLCKKCSETHVYCGCCGHHVPKEEYDFVKRECKRCTKRRKMQDAIKSYSYKPSPRYKYTEKERTRNYYGIEWEMELSDSSDYDRYELAYEINEIAEDFAYCKSDGSLDNGVEFVTEPITLKALEHTYFDKLEEISNKMKEMKVKRSCQTAGIHIHYSREHLSDLQIKKICYVLSRNDIFEKLTSFCKRSSDRIERWADRYNLRNGYDDFYPSDGSRYRVVNLGNRNTIEFRCFGYTTSVKDIRAFVYFVDSVVSYCKKASKNDIIQVDFYTLATFKHKTFMNKYLKERKI